MIWSVGAGHVAPALDVTMLCRSLSASCAGAAVARCTWLDMPLVSAPTPYSVVVAAQYWVGPRLSENASNIACEGSLFQVIETTTGIESVTPPLSMIWPMSGLKAGYVMLGAPWSRTGPSLASAVDASGI